MHKNNVAVIGLGYIGLPTAILLASRDVHVQGIDVDLEKLSLIRNGDLPFWEPGMEELLQVATEKHTFTVSEHLTEADIFIIAVPTPLSDEKKYADLSFIKNVVAQIAVVLKKGDLIIVESTSPVGTTEQVSSWMEELRPDLSFPHNAGVVSDISIAYCPERVIPGHTLKELISNDRIIGGMTAKCSKRASDFYEIFVSGERFLTDNRTAEMSKLTENAFRDTNIAFANELSMICEELDINVWELINLANKHPRVNILQPGPGVGGHCIAVDPWFIVSKSPTKARLIREARRVNDEKANWVCDQIRRTLDYFLKNDPQKELHDLRIAFFGITFKADIDDLRESPALKIVQTIANEHPGKVLVIEPNITTLPSSLNEICRKVNCDDALVEADIAVLLVEHKEFASEDVVKGIQDKFVIDTKGLWTTKQNLN